jgi:hypothetical protein
VNVFPFFRFVVDALVGGGGNVGKVGERQLSQKGEGDCPPIF